MPDLPVLTIEQDPRSSQVLWAGTYAGVYRSGDSGQTWSRYGTGLPNVMVANTQLFADSSKLRIATFGWGYGRSRTAG